MSHRRAVPAAVRDANRLHAQRTRGLPPLVAARLREVEQHLARGDVSAAELALMSATVLAGAHPEVLRWTGSLLSRQGRYAEAIAAFERSLAAQPGDPLVLRQLAAAATETGADDRAQAALHEAAVAASEPAEQLHVAIELDRQGYIEAALALVERVLVRADTPTARLLRARCLQAR